METNCSPNYPMKKQMNTVRGFLCVHVNDDDGEVAKQQQANPPLIERRLLVHSGRP